MGKSNKISILQFGHRGISRVRLAPSGKGLAVLSCDRAEGDWTGDGDAGLTEAMSAFLAEHPVEDDLVCSVLPRHDVTARILKLPTHEPDEASSMVRLSAEEFVPYSVNELTIDDCMLEKLPSGESRVLAVLVHRDVIEGHVAALRKAGVVPDHVYLSTACLATAVREARGVQPEQFAITDLAAGGLEVLVMEAGRLLYSRGIAGTMDWSKVGMSEEVDSELGNEVRDSLGAYRRESEDGIGVDTVYVSSDWMDCTRAAEALALETGKSCSAADFSSVLAVAGAEKLDAPMLTALGAGLTALGKAHVAIELLPESVTKVRGIATARSTLIQGAAFVAVMLVSLGLLFAQAVQQRSSLIRELEEIAAGLAPSALDVTAKLDKLRILEEQVTREGTALEVLATVSKTAPPDLNVTRFVYDRERGVDIFGRAKTRDIAFSFAERLRKLGERSAGNDDDAGEHVKARLDEQHPLHQDRPKDHREH